MQDKQKVTLYLPPQLHRQLKIKSAIDEASMSALVERAISFFLEHPEVVDEVEMSSGNQGQTHRVYTCPECASALVQREGDLLALKSQPSVLADGFSEELAAEKVRERIGISGEVQDQESLVTC